MKLTRMLGTRADVGNRAVRSKDAVNRDQFSTDAGNSRAGNNRAGSNRARINWAGKKHTSEKNMVQGHHICQPYARLL